MTEYRIFQRRLADGMRTYRQKTASPELAAQLAAALTTAQTEGEIEPVVRVTFAEQHPIERPVAA